MQPALLWKVIVNNRRFRSIQVEQITLLQPCKGMRISNLKTACPAEKIRFFVNGWQSWSFAGSSSWQEPAMRSHLGLLQNPMVVDAGLTNFFRHGAVADMFAVLYDAEQQKGCLLGFLSQKEQFGHVALPDWRKPALLMWADADNVNLEAGSTLQTDWAVVMPVEGPHSKSIAPYLDLVARENKVHYAAEIPAGWCSWYQYYQRIDEDIIRDNLDMLKEHRAEFPGRSGTDRWMVIKNRWEIGWLSAPGLPVECSPSAGTSGMPVLHRAYGWHLSSFIALRISLKNTPIGSCASTMAARSMPGLCGIPWALPSISPSPMPANMCSRSSARLCANGNSLT
jgi:hypothetical protein